MLHFTTKKSLNANRVSMLHFTTKKSSNAKRFSKAKIFAKTLSFGTQNAWRKVEKKKWKGKGLRDGWKKVWMRSESRPRWLRGLNALLHNHLSVSCWNYMKSLENEKKKKLPSVSSLHLSTLRFFCVLTEKEFVMRESIPPRWLCVNGRFLPPLFCSTEQSLSKVHMVNIVSII